MCSKFSFTRNGHFGYRIISRDGSFTDIHFSHILLTLNWSRILGIILIITIGRNSWNFDIKGSLCSYISFMVCHCSCWINIPYFVISHKYFYLLLHFFFSRNVGISVLTLTFQYWSSRWKNKRYMLKFNGNVDFAFIIQTPISFNFYLIYWIFILDILDILYIS